jgi:hypothetical protein
MKWRAYRHTWDYYANGGDAQYYVSPSRDDTGAERWHACFHAPGALTEHDRVTTIGWVASLDEAKELAEQHFLEQEREARGTP